MFLSVDEAIKKLQEITSQNCNEISLLHYVWNGYLDLYIRTKKDQEIDIVSIGLHGFLCDDEWVVYNLKNNCEGLYRVKLDDLKASNLLEVLENENSKIKVILVYQIGDSELAFLTKQIESNMPFNIKNFYENKTDEMIASEEIYSSLGFGKFFGRSSFCFDETQFSNIKFGKPHNKNTAGFENKDNRKLKIKNIVLWAARRIYTKNQELTKEILAMDSIEFLKKNIDNLQAKQERLNISGEIVLPKFDTVRRWEALTQLMDEINPDRNK